MNITGKRILLTGGNGFLGRHVQDKLSDHGCTQIAAPSRDECDLTSQAQASHLFAEFRPEVVIHLAANVGGIGKNRRSPGRIFLDNMAMGVNVLDLSVAASVEKLVMVGTACSYPKNSTPPFSEDDLFDGYPEPTNAPYGIAKRALGEGLAACHKQYGIDSAYLIPTNLYGPGDNFDPDDSHVIPALIRKMTEAVDNQEDTVTVWGSGNATREFLYVDDAADAIVRAASVVETHHPINLGTGGEISIGDLANKIAKQCGYEGRLVFDSTMPDGQPRRLVDSSRANSLMGWTPKTDLDDGLTQTIRWFQNEQAQEARLTNGE